MPDVPRDIASANAALADALAGLYAAFAIYPAPRKLHASRLRDAANILKDLKSTPLKSLPAVAVGPFAMYSMTTVGDVEDYKHFLPRIIHLGIIGSHGEPGLEASAIAAKLEYGGWSSWRDEERSAIVKAYEAAWARLRFFHPDDRDAEDWLTGMAMLGIEVVTRLNVWSDDDVPASMAQFAQFIARMRDLNNPEEFSVELAAGVRRAMVDFICGGRAAAALRRAASRAAASDLWLFKDAEKAIAFLRQAGG
jgi:hypothetical protein